MSSQSGFGFGVFIAYVLPGFLVLVGLALVFPAVEGWLVGSANASPALGGVIYSTAASVLIGLLLGVLRWAILDRCYAVTGIRRSPWDETKLQANIDAFRVIVENHYRYYEFFGHMVFAVPVAAVLLRVSEHGAMFPSGSIELATLILVGFLVAGSRDALRQYFSRSQVLFGMEVSDMTNGNHPKPPKAGTNPQSAASPSSDAPKKPATADK